MLRGLPLLSAAALAALSAAPSSARAASFDCNAGALRLALQPALDALPNISVPALAVQVKVTPGEEVRAGDKLTRRALHVAISSGAADPRRFAGGR